VAADTAFNGQVVGTAAEGARQSVDAFLTVLPISCGLSMTLRAQWQRAQLPLPPAGAWRHATAFLYNG
jgi:hypothetical protein